MINNMTVLSISGVAVWNIVQKLGEEIADITNANLHSKLKMAIDVNHF
jgi:hypothetical protein